MSDICNIFKSQCQHKITLLLHNILHDGFSMLWASTLLNEMFPNYTVFSVLFHQCSSSCEIRVGVGVAQYISRHQRDKGARSISEHKLLLGLWGRGCWRLLHSIFFKDNILQNLWLVECLPVSKPAVQTNRKAVAVSHWSGLSYSSRVTTR